MFQRDKSSCLSISKCSVNRQEEHQGAQLYAQESKAEPFEEEFRQTEWYLSEFLLEADKEGFER